MPVVHFADLIFKGLTRNIVLREETALKVIVTVNSEFIVAAHENRKLQRIINDNFSTFDGQLPYLIAKIKNRTIYFEKISGSDLIYDVCSLAKSKNKKIFLLGGYEYSNQQSVERLRRKYKIIVDGFAPKHEPYPFNEELNKNILEKLESFRPDILFVAFGMPKQEFWIDDNKYYLDKIGVKLAIGVGGTFEFVSGKEKRAPKVIQEIGLEGVWRLIQSPKRIKRFIRNFKVLKYYAPYLLRKADSPRLR